MQKPIPSNIALAVNNTVAPRDRLDVVPAFRSLEDKYAVAIKVSHTGSSVIGYRGTGKVLFSDGDYTKAQGGKARGAAEVGQMIHYTLSLLMWAKDAMPTPEVITLLDRFAGAKH